MEQDLKRVAEQNIIEKIRLLESHQLTEVIDFIEFLSEKKKRENIFFQLLNEASEPIMSIADVRRYVRL